MQTIVVIGGAECVHQDLLAARELCALSNIVPVYYVCNDMIPEFPGECVAVTLHPHKIVAWMGMRAAHHYPVPSQIWGHRKQPGTPISHSTRDWLGSVGLFACKVAIEQGHKKVVLCGVPMLTEANHFIRKMRWNACTAFRPSWQAHQKEIAPYVRSMSGWTQQFLGAPDIAWLVEGSPSQVSSGEGER